MPTSPSPWSVEYQTETIGIGPDGKAVEGVKVGFATTEGVHGSVFLPKARYNVVNVKQAIAEQYGHIKAVHGLTG